MSIVCYMNDCIEKPEDFDQMFRFYRKICFICTSVEQLECVKNQFLRWKSTHDFPVDFSFNLIDDIHRYEQPWMVRY